MFDFEIHGKQYKTRYPNLLEEISRRTFMSGHVIKAANITQGLLNAVLLQGEALSEKELVDTAIELGRPCSYLGKPSMKYFGKSKSDKRELAKVQSKVDKLVELRRTVEAKGVKIRHWADKHYKDVMGFCDEMTRRGVTTYGHYYLAVDAIEHATSLIYSDMSKAEKAARPLPRDVQRRCVALAAALAQ